LIAILNPLLGYETSSLVIKKANAQHKTVRQILLEDKLFTEEELNTLVKQFLTDQSK
jgi:aspartate ammonia-lyase